MRGVTASHGFIFTYLLLVLHAAHDISSSQTVNQNKSTNKFLLMGSSQWVNSWRASSLTGMAWYPHRWFSHINLCSGLLSDIIHTQKFQGLKLQMQLNFLVPSFAASSFKDQWGFDCTKSRPGCSPPLCLHVYLHITNSSVCSNISISNILYIAFHLSSVSILPYASIPLQIHLLSMGCLCPLCIWLMDWTAPLAWAHLTHPILHINGIAINVF